MTPTPHGKRALRNSRKKVDDVSKILIVIYQNRMMTRARDDFLIPLGSLLSSRFFDGL